VVLVPGSSKNCLRSDLIFFLKKRTHFLIFYHGIKNQQKL
jgi:hypothetical protein